MLPAEQQSADRIGFSQPVAVGGLFAQVAAGLHATIRRIPPRWTRYSRFQRAIGAAESARAVVKYRIMSVSNPDMSKLQSDPLHNTGRVAVKGTPAKGWKLVSWDGHPAA